MRHPLFRDATSKIVGERVSIFRSMFFNKPAEVPGVSEGGVVINWHQDGNPVTEGNPDLAGKAQGGGWGLSIDPRLTIWTALDRTTIENGCLQIIRTIIIFESCCASGAGSAAAAFAAASACLQVLCVLRLAMAVRYTCAAGSHHSPISSTGDLLNEREREIHAPEHNRVHLEMEQG